MSSVYDYESKKNNDYKYSSENQRFDEKPSENFFSGDTATQVLKPALLNMENPVKSVSGSDLPEFENFVQELSFNFSKETDAKESKEGFRSNITDSSSTKTNQEVMDTGNEDTTCGIFNFRPQWIQKFATPRTFLVLYCIIGVLQGSYYSYFIGTLSTVEKRFAFKSKMSGFILIVNEISPFIFGFLVGYFGGKTHRIRLLAVGMMLSSLCCFSSAFPYFIFGAAQHLTSQNVLKKGDELCDSYMGMKPCNSDDRPPTTAAILFFILAQFLKGFGDISYYTIGVSYLDDNAKKKNTPLYFGTVFALRLFGPLLGYLMSSVFLKLYENPFDDPGYGPEDPRWIGGWWMGFCLQGILLTIATLPIFLFPRRLSNPSDHQKKGSQEDKETILSLILGFFQTLKRLGKNPVFVLIVLNVTLEIGSFGHHVMLPKYMENQFRLTASDANLYSGPPGIVAVMIAFVSGGYLMHKYRPSAKFLLMGLVCTQILSTVGYLVLIIPQCEKVEMLNFGMEEKGLILEGPCNTNCSCTTKAFTPVCGPDGKTTYFTPCYGGCTSSLITEFSTSKRKAFYGCSCISEFSEEQGKDVKEGFAKEGFCVVEGCWSQALIYIILFPFLQMAGSILRIAHTILLLRSVHPKDKSAAVGALESLISLLGYLPYLALFGTLVDSSCLVWEEKCGETGNCWFYDTDRFSYLLHGSSAVCALLSAVCTLAIYFLSSRIRDLYDDDEEKNAATEVSKMEKKTDANTKL